MRLIFAVCMSLSLIFITEMSYAECTEYKIIDHGSSVEAVCVGAPLKETDKIEFEKQNALQEEKDKRNAVIECYEPLAKYKNYITKPAYYEQERARCQKLEVDLSMYLASKPKKPEYQTTTTPQFDDSATLAAEMQRQQAEMQRQQAEMQRMQQQQKFNQIWK